MKEFLKPPFMIQPSKTIVREQHSKQEILQLGPQTLKELCALYGVKYKVMRNMLRPLYPSIGKPFGRFYSVLQVQAIIETLGPPYILVEPQVIVE